MVDWDILGIAGLQDGLYNVLACSDEPVWCVPNRQPKLAPLHCYKASEKSDDQAYMIQCQQTVVRQPRPPDWASVHLCGQNQARGTVICIHTRAGPAVQELLASDTLVGGRE
jgi:hypothetical protein